MLLTINPSGPDPIYLQLVRQIQAAVASGRLTAGERVPSHRELALQLTVNHLTVKRAFDELERAGLLTTRRGMGTYVVDVLPRNVVDGARSALSADLSRAASAARSAGLDREAWIALAEKAWKELR